ncbi:hypothetical protein AB0M68_36035 [Streptomyces sp. NPDC051453]|uniref:hypothetical protein n=1 Tax=Streptomyces sp. NPDC051453 TaxID=3154941 RepID=UPI003419D9D8
MNSLLTEVGRKLADRWLSALVLPGALFVSAAMCGRWLGHSHALDTRRLQDMVQRVGQQLDGRPAAVLLAVAGALLGATGAGLAVQGTAAGVRRAWVARRPARWVAWRRRRAQSALTRRGHTVPTRYLPARATTIGDRFRLVDQRVDAQYGLAVALAWPRLWLLLADAATTAIRDATTRYRAATETTAWGILYLLLGAIWWPAALAGLVMVTVGQVRGRATGAALADLVEAAVDIHQRPLAETLGIDLPHGRITPEEGARINDILNKRA